MDVLTMNAATQSLMNYKAERKRLLAAVRTAKALGLSYDEPAAQAAEMLGAIQRQKKRIRALVLDAGECVKETDFIHGNPSPSAEWRQGRILGDRYEISDDGFVRNALTKRLIARAVRYSRGVVHVLNKEGKPSTFMLDKLVADAWLHFPASKMLRHLDEDKLNCRKENLA